MAKKKLRSSVKKKAPRPKAGPRPGRQSDFGLRGRNRLLDRWNRLSTSEVRANMATVFDRVAEGERFLLDLYGGKVLGAIISREEAAVLAWLDLPRNKKLKASIAKALDAM